MSNKQDSAETAGSKTLEENLYSNSGSRNDLLYIFKASHLTSLCLCFARCEMKVIIICLFSAPGGLISKYLFGT